MQGSYRTGGAGRPRRLPSVEIPGVLYTAQVPLDHAHKAVPIPISGRACIRRGQSVPGLLVHVCGPDPYSIVCSHEDGGAPDRHGSGTRTASRKAAVREGRAGSQSGEGAERQHTLYVLAAAISNLVCAGSVPCHAALPGREWQYAWTRPASLKCEGCPRCVRHGDPEL